MVHHAVSYTHLANNGEELVLLDGTTAKLQPNTLVIADQTGPLAMAAVSYTHLFYTLNRSELTYAICHTLGIRPTTNP